MAEAREFHPVIPASNLELPQYCGWGVVLKDKLRNVMQEL